MADERIGDYRVHPAAQLFPLLADASEEFEKLKRSIKEHGQQLSVIVRGDMLLDGRNRLRACLALGIPAKVEEYSGPLLPSELIGDLNLNRRELTLEDRVRIVAELELITQAERQAAAQKAAGERGKEGGKKAGRGRPIALDSELSPGLSRRDNRAKKERSTERRVARAAGVPDHVARKAIKEAKAKKRKVGAVPALPQSADSAPSRDAVPRIVLGSVQRTHALLLEFAVRPQPVSREEIIERLGWNTPRDKRRQFEAFVNCASHVPWAVIEKEGSGLHFRIDAELKDINEGGVPMPELNGWTARDVLSFLKALRRALAQKRTANNTERFRRQWNPDKILKLEMVKILDFVEEELDKVTVHKFPPTAEKRPTRLSVGDADPIQGDLVCQP